MKKTSNERIRIIKIVEKGIDIASITEKTISVIISYIIADWINDTVSIYFRIDSFLLTNFIGITIIVLTLTLYFYWRGSKNKK
ncbi:hypothetical protein BCR24_13620 [Enterococcus ureilyticus]|uniref:Uncharacterized protein n=2 Tax=Enterococcus TaxID=1350 RepID=A0A1E5HEH2_9ENTE|nr:MULTISPECIES: hypothetical protein [Enterococcus]ALS37569.1 hypothetical protein ATZ35_10515 [Enterococcus rotai]MBM7689929.1 hypothetical protein [Enterococcus ureilyticus]OEG23030.1 hypothetical protein BCR24_13620 [Enterococcus ureilyticus]